LPCTVWESDLSELATSGGVLNPWIFFGNGAFENHSTRLHIAARFFWLTYIEIPAFHLQPNRRCFSLS
jgi:hypothetical protein